MIPILDRITIRLTTAIISPSYSMTVQQKQNTISQCNWYQIVSFKTPIRNNKGICELNKLPYSSPVVKTKHFNVYQPQLQIHWTKAIARA